MRVVQKVLVLLAVIAVGCEKPDEAGTNTGSSVTCEVASSSSRGLKVQKLPSLKQGLLDSLDLPGGSLRASSKPSLPKGTSIIIGKSGGCGELEAVTLEKTTTVDEFVKAYEGDDCVTYLEHNRKLYPTALPALGPAASFNDSLVANQGHLSAIKHSTAYDLFYNASNGINNEVAVIAIMDTGVQGSHPDLANRYWQNLNETPGDGIDNDLNGYVDDIRGFNFKNNSGDPEPISWGAGDNGHIHGTHVAGLAAAVSNNGTGVVGVGGPNVAIMDLNIFGGDDGAEILKAAEAIDYAIDNGADVLNVSLAAGGTSTTLEQKITAAVQAGIVVVIAAGNSFQAISESSPIMPAIYGAGLAGAITVGASYSDTFGLTNYSNYGSSYVEIAAPGSDSSSVGLLSLDASSNYTRLEGTSMATPVVSGAAALAIALRGERSQTVSPALVESWLKESGATQEALGSCVTNNKHLDLESLYNTVDGQ